MALRERTTLGRQLRSYYEAKKQDLGAGLLKKLGEFRELIIFPYSPILFT